MEALLFPVESFTFVRPTVITCPSLTPSQVDDVVVRVGIDHVAADTSCSAGHAGVGYAREWVGEGKDQLVISGDATAPAFNAGVSGGAAN